MRTNQFLKQMERTIHLLYAFSKTKQKTPPDATTPQQQQTRTATIAAAYGYGALYSKLFAASRTVRHRQISVKIAEFECQCFPLQLLQLVAAYLQLNYEHFARTVFLPAQVRGTTVPEPVFVKRYIRFLHITYYTILALSSIGQNISIAAARAHEQQTVADEMMRQIHTENQSTTGTTTANTKKERETDSISIL